MSVSPENNSTAPACDVCPLLRDALERAIVALDYYGWGVECDAARMQGYAAIEAARPATGEEA